MPPPADGHPSSRPQGTAGTRLGLAIAPLLRAHEGRSGVVPLVNGRDAFAARVRLADAAEQSLDVQYYIWNKDLSGTLLFDALRRAAERGVRVRFLLDDHNTIGLDETLFALHSHPNMEVRLFNPFRFRRWRPLEYLVDFARLNRRMHNKSFTADNQATVIGGRNVGDEYFGAGEDLLFVDLDVLAIGPVVDDVSRDFERYWASDSSCPAARVLPEALRGSSAGPALDASAIERHLNAPAYLRSIAESDFVRDLLARSLAIEWAPVDLVSDDPAKGMGAAADDKLLWSRLKRAMMRPTRDLELVSPYFVPGEEGVSFFRSLSEDRVEAAVLTNSLEATDVAIVHAGYARRRQALLKAGVRLFEMKRTASAAPAGEERTRIGHGSSASSLHAKTFSVDGARIFIGSFNFDPRSARLNTEMGFVIHSPALARSIGDTFARSLPATAYEVRLGEDGTLRWLERAGSATVVHEHEPGTTFWKRLAVSLIALLPIEWLL